MPRPGIDRATEQRGIALVAVLWLLLVLSIIAAGTLRNTLTETDLVRNGLEASKARVVADAAVQRAILALTASELEPGWPRDGTPVVWSFRGWDVRISVQDEAGKIDLNHAPPRLLRGLFLAAGLEETPATALADAVVDYRDANDLRRLNGAEDADYRQAGYPRGAKDAPFERIGELRRVFGMSRAIFERVEPAVTVYTNRATIDPQTAPRLALLAVPGSDLIAVDRYIVRRARLSVNNGISNRTLAPPIAANGFFSSDGNSNVFMIRAEALRASGARFVRSAVVRLTSLAGTPFKLERWKQDLQGRDK